MAFKLELMAEISQLLRAVNSFLINWQSHGNMILVPQPVKDKIKC